MKRILFPVLFALCSSLAFAQDLIVKSNGDSLNCRITKTKPEGVFFIYRDGYEILNSFLKTSDIAATRPGFYEKSEIPADWGSGIGEFKPWQFSLDGGFSFRIGKLPTGITDDMKRYINELKSGYNIAGGISYFVTPSIGAGFKVNRFFTSNSAENLCISETQSSKQYGSVSNDMKITFIGPGLATRAIIGSIPNYFYSNYYLGYIKYYDKSILPSKKIMRGEAIGFCMDAGFDFGLFENLRMAFQVTMVEGVLKKYTLISGGSVTTVTLPKGQYESLFRIDASIGFRIVL